MTSLSDGDCPRNGVWSSWSDFDNPGGTGDWELRQDRTDVCDIPVAVEGRVVGTHEETTSENVRVDIVQGIWCENQNQEDGSCQDYEVRFCCAQGKQNFYSL